MKLCLFLLTIGLTPGDMALSQVKLAAIVVLSLLLMKLSKLFIPFKLSYHRQ